MHIDAYKTRITIRNKEDGDNGGINRDSSIFKLKIALHILHIIYSLNQLLIRSPYSVAPSSPGGWPGI